MAITPALGAAAYQQAASLSSGGAAATGAASGAADGSFANILSGALHSAVQTLQTGEQMAANHVAGQADIVDVVNAVNSAELTLDTVVAVRDKVISAYQSIMQMPI